MQSMPMEMHSSLLLKFVGDAPSPKDSFKKTDDNSNDVVDKCNKKFLKSSSRDPGSSRSRRSRNGLKVLLKWLIKCWLSTSSMSCENDNLLENQMQWGSQYRTCSVFKWSKKVGCQMVWLLYAIWIPDSSTIWIPYKWTLSCFLMYWSGIWMVSLVHMLTL